MDKMRCMDESALPLYRIKGHNGLKFSFMPNGSLYNILDGNIMVNLYSGSLFDAAPANIFLRIINDEGIHFAPLVGLDSAGSISGGKDGMASEGFFDDIEYRLSFKPLVEQAGWILQIRLINVGDANTKADLIYIQDVGLAERSTVTGNEYHVSQYVEHDVIDDDDFGYVIRSRQNLEHDGLHPWLVSGCFERATDFLTDGGLFYGAGFKDTGIPEAPLKAALGNIHRQHEFACQVLQSRAFELAPGCRTSCTFFSLYDPGHSALPSGAELKRVVVDPACTSASDNTVELDRCPNIFSIASLFNSLPLNDYELNEYFGTERRHVETQHGELLSFFTGSNSHVVLKSKELIAMRPHGHIIRDPETIYPDDDIISSTVWMNGIFNSHLSLGNTLFNKCLGVVRGAYNFLRSSGQRIFIDTENGYKMLAMPSAFEMGLNFCRWIYKGRDEKIIVRVWAAADSPAIVLDVHVNCGTHDFIVTHNLVMGSSEYEGGTEIFCDYKRRRITALAGRQTEFRQLFRDHRFDISIHGVEDFELGCDELVFTDGTRRGYPFAVAVAENTADFTLALSGSATWRDFDELTGNLTERDLSFEESCRYAEKFWDKLCRQTMISCEHDRDGISRLNDILPWYVHNAMIGLSTPYGLEQHTAGGWRVRDICQGAVEMLTALRQYEAVRRIICCIFKHQYAGTARWPQWFMFDRYYKFQRDHGDSDLIVWPLKAVCDYIEASGDYSILEEEIAYTLEELNFTSGKEMLSEHIGRLVDALEDSFIPGTELIAYGADDWNDGFKPVRGGTTSSCTVELLYETLNRYVEICFKSDRLDDVSHIESIVAIIRNDFNKYLVKDGITAGYACIDKDGKVDLVFHPDDDLTGVKYCLPSAVCGIVSGIFSHEQAEAHLEMIRENLLMPDGVHMMNLPPVAHGGIAHYFHHAERAALFGRESGSCCTHAHLRYCEALAMLGKADELYNAILTADPISLNSIVPNAGIRQSNCSVGSSDAGFNDRQQALAEYDLFRQGKVKSEAGWRIYSSVPGIFVRLLLDVFLGVRNCHDKVIFDPVMPLCLGSVTYRTVLDEKPVEVRYKLVRRSHSPEEIIVNGVAVEFELQHNPYRTGGAVVDRGELDRMLDRDMNTILLLL